MFEVVALATSAVALSGCSAAGPSGGLRGAVAAAVAADLSSGS